MRLHGTRSRIDRRGGRGGPRNFEQVAIDLRRTGPYRNGMMLRRLMLLVCCGMALLLAGCVHVKTDPIRIEPIYIEITINHRVQQELEDVFAEIDRASATMDYKPLESEPEK
jgi:hypothetical protein